MRNTWIGSSIAVTSWVLTALGSGCHDAGDEPPPPAHSASFYPLSGSLENGAPAETLLFRYRVNGGKPVVVDNDATLRADDFTITVSVGRSITTDLTETVVISKDEQTTTSHMVDRLSSQEPATIVGRTADLTMEATDASGVTTRMQHVSYEFSRRIFYARDDLDSLDIGFSESQDVRGTGTTNGTTSSAGSSTSTKPQMIMLEATDSWTVREKLATFDVAGTTFSNVVRVDYESSVALGEVSGAASVAATMWLAKGIGMIRTEQHESLLGTDLMVAYELIETNLIGP